RRARDRGMDVRVLILSPYPPDRCGIASYTVQVAATLRREGHTVDVVSPLPSAARHFADYSHTVRGVLRVLAMSRRADRTVIEFFPDLLFRSLRRNQFIRQRPAAALLFSLGHNVEQVVHEAPYRNLHGWRARATRRRRLLAGTHSRGRMVLRVPAQPGSRQASHHAPRELRKRRAVRPLDRGLRRGGPPVSRVLVIGRAAAGQALRQAGGG